MRVVCEDVQGSNENETGFDRAMYMSRVERAGSRNRYRYHDSSFSKAPGVPSPITRDGFVPLQAPKRPSDRIERGARAPALLVTESISLWRA